MDPPRRPLNLSSSPPPSLPAGARTSKSRRRSARRSRRWAQASGPPTSSGGPARAPPTQMGYGFSLISAHETDRGFSQTEDVWPSQPQGEKIRQTSGPTRKPSAEATLKDIRRATRRQFSAEEKTRIVLEGLRGEESIAELCRRKWIDTSIYYAWFKEFLDAGKRRLTGDTARASLCGRIWTPPDCNDLLGLGLASRLLTYIRLSEAARYARRRKPRWVSARLVLNAPETSAVAVPVHTSGSRGDGP